MIFVSYILFFLSGCTSLIYEVVWTRQFMLLLGSTTYAITTVVVAFMAGLALGSYLAGRWSHRVRQPGRVYASLEFAIGLYALLVPILLAAAEPIYRALYGHAMNAPWLLTGLRFAVSMLVLIVPTTCMGATLPIMMTYLTRGDRKLGLSAGYLYGINAIGATLGCMLAGFGLMPAMGLTSTTRLAAAINFLIGVVGWIYLRGDPQQLSFAASTSRKPAKIEKAALAPILPSAYGIVLAAAAVSGLASMVYQIAWTRALVMSIGSSTYSFTCILAAFIMGLGLGSLALARFVDRFERPLLILGFLEFGIGISAAFIVPVHGRIPLMVQTLVAAHYQDYRTILTLEFLLVVSVTVVPTFMMGAAFPLMTRIVGQRHTKPGEAIGRVYVINTVGAIVGCLLAGFVLIRSEFLGIRGSITAAALANALIGAWLIYQARPAGWTKPRLATATFGGIGAVLAAGTLVGRWDIDQMTSGAFRKSDVSPKGRVLYFREGIDTTVAVKKALNMDIMSLTVNGKSDASTNFNDVRTQLLLGHLPALLDPQARRGCVIGLGCGMTLAAVARHPSYERIDCIEISDAVIGGANLFEEYNDNILHRDPRVRLIRGDGRNHLLLTPEKYDLIVSEPSNPWISGVSSLFTREFFELCQQRLNHGGRLAIWTHSYSMSQADFRMVIRTLGDVFGFASLWILHDSDFCVIAGNEPFQIPATKILERYANQLVRADLYRAGIRDAAGVMGTFIMGGSALKDWAASAPVHTDDNSILEFSAPRHFYAEEGLALLQDLCRNQRSPFDDVIRSSSDSASDKFKNRVGAVIDARMAISNGLQMWQDGNAPKALQALIEGYQGDLGNSLTFRQLCSVRNSVEAKASSVQQIEEIQKWVEKFERLPYALDIPTRNSTLPEIAQWFFKTSRQYMATHLPTAIDCLIQAHELVPDDGRIAGALASLWIQTNQLERSDRLLAEFLQKHPEDGWANFAAAHLAIQQQKLDQAVAHVEHVLNSGTIAPEKLAADPWLTPLRDHASFQSLLQRYASSQPN